MSTSAGHPVLLLWYVSGLLEPPEEREIEGHLRECESCRLDAAAMGSMMKSLRRQSQVDHVAAEDLVDYVADEIPSPARRVPVSRHLDDCAECREDRDLVRSARLREQEPGREGKRETAAAAPRAAGRRRWRRLPGPAWALPAAAAALALLLLAPGILRPSGETPILSESRPVIFHSPLRGAEEERTLQAPGPWQIRVLLPFDPAQGRYRVRVETDHAAPRALVETLAASDAEGSLWVRLEALPGPGRYRMSLLPLDQGDGEAIVYPFSVVPR